MPLNEADDACAQSQRPHCLRLGIPRVCSLYCYALILCRGIGRIKSGRNWAVNSAPWRSAATDIRKFQSFLRHIDESESKDLDLHRPARSPLSRAAHRPMGRSGMGLRHNSLQELEEVAVGGQHEGRV